MKQVVDPRHPSRDRLWEMRNNSDCLFNAIPNLRVDSPRRSYDVVNFPVVKRATLCNVARKGQTGGGPSEIEPPPFASATISLGCVMKGRLLVASPRCATLKEVTH